MLSPFFSSPGGYQSLDAFSDGMSTAVLVGAGVVALGALAAFAMPGRPRAEREPAQVRPEVEEAA